MINTKQQDLFGNTADFNTTKNITGTLLSRFIVPPFSVLDTKQGYWQQRKREWLKITGDLEATRENTLFTEGEQVNEIQKRMLDIGSTSQFDPVLAELVYKWFNKAGGRILDPFGGEQTKGVVAGELGMPYTAIEFRKEQVDFNNNICTKYKDVKYITGDSMYLDMYILDSGYDLCFTSPPYYDLEIYSAKDSSAFGSYYQFMDFYEKVFRHVYNKLKNNSFLVLKVSEIRDEHGRYRGFVADNINVMKKIGFNYYNEGIILNAIGTAMLRTEPFSKNRKLVRVHQNLLIFYKGNVGEISKYYPYIMGEQQ